MRMPIEARGRISSSVYTLLGPDTPGVLIVASRDPDAKFTYLRLDVATGTKRTDTAGLAVKLPTTAAAGAVVDKEGRMLVELRRRPLGQLQQTIPRYVGSRQFGGNPVLVSTVLPGHSMSVEYHQWWHTSRPGRVAHDFTVASEWLERFQSATMLAGASRPWPAQVAEALRGRWDGHRLLDMALAKIGPDRALSDHDVPCTAVHGDFWFGNLLLDDGRLVGVVDWEGGENQGSPLRDLARFVLSYSLYLDRHTRDGRQVLGHRGLRRCGVAPGVAHALRGHGWYPRLVHNFLTHGLRRLQLPAELWYDVALTGIAEVAALANDRRFGEEHLTLLAELPLHARRYR